MGQKAKSENISAKKWKLQSKRKKKNKVFEQKNRRPLHNTNWKEMNVSMLNTLDFLLPLHSFKPMKTVLVLHPSFPESLFSYMPSFLYPSFPFYTESLLFCISSFLNPSFPESSFPASFVFWIPRVLNPFLPESLLFLSPSFPASLSSCVSPFCIPPF